MIKAISVGIVGLTSVACAFAASPGRHLSGDYVMSVDGVEIDVLHLALYKTSPEKCWANCAIYIQPTHGQPMYDTLYMEN